MAEKVKKMTLGVTGNVSMKSSAENESGERRIKFVASSVNQDRHHETVNVESLRLPLKKGGEIVAGAIPAEGVHNLVDIPLMLNHSADVRDTIGSVRSAFFENGELIFEAGISQRDVAQEMLTLLEEGHLSNAFSITMSDYDYNFETGLISNAEVIEVSLVFRGSNKEARLLSIKSLEDEKMSIEKRATTDNYGEAVQEVAEEVQKVEEVVAEENPKTSEEDTKPNKKEDKMKTHQEVARDEIVAKPSQASKAVVNDYLNSKSAITDFAEVLRDNAGAEAGEVKKAWAAKLKEKGVTNPDTLLPGALVTAIKDAIESNGTIFKAVAKTGLTVLRVTAETIGLGDTGRARGHNGKGADKKETDLTFVDRVIRGQFIYSYITLNKEDVRENQDTGALVKFVMETLPKRIVAEIERAIVLGDGRSSDGDEITSFKSIKADVKDSADTFAKKYTPTPGESLFESVVRAGAEIRYEGSVALVLSKKTLADLKLAKDKNGAFILPVGGDIKGLLNVSEIFTPEWMNETNESEFSAFLFAPEAYKTVGDTTIESFTNFALKQNKHEYLQEIYAGGALGEAKSAVGIAKS